MKTLTDYLDQCKEKKGFSKDAELAEYLGITKASLSVMKKGGGASQETAEKIAQGAGVDLGAVWMASLVQKEQNPRFKAILENVTKRSGIAATLAIVAVLSAGVTNSMETTKYTLCEVNRRLREWLKGIASWQRKKAVSTTFAGTVFG